MLNALLRTGSVFRFGAATARPLLSRKPASGGLKSRGKRLTKKGMKDFTVLIRAIMATLALMALPLAAPAAQTCSAPGRPGLPKNAAAISHAELDAAAARVAAYLRAFRAYQECLDTIITDPKDHSRAQWRMALKAYNASAPAMEEVWQSYQKLAGDWARVHHAKAKAGAK